VRVSKINNLGYSTYQKIFLEESSNGSSNLYCSQCIWFIVRSNLPIGFAEGTIKDKPGRECSKPFKKGSLEMGWILLWMDLGNNSKILGII
jgi:hypothetical protein